jgi:hypothetical protein
VGCRVGEPTRWSTLRTWAGGLLAVLNAAFWFRLVLATQPLPLADMADRPPTFTRTESGGMQFDSCSDCGPIFVLAGRDVGLPWFEEDPLRVFMQRANLIGMLADVVAALAEGPLGYHASTWAGTFAFALASTCQWWGLGWVLGGLTNRIRRASLKERHH